MDYTREAKSNIFRLTGFQKDMDYPALSELRAYWEALRNGRPVPARSEIDPRGIESALEYTFILEQLAPRVARFRLAGTHLNDLMGMEVRGMPITTFFAPVARAELSETLEKVFAGPKIVELSLAAESGFGRPPLNARLLILPLKSDLGYVTRAIGCLVAKGSIGRAPRRFVVAGTQITDIIGRTWPKPVPERVPGFAEAHTGFEPAKTSAPISRGHLRLVKSDR